MAKSSLDIIFGGTYKVTKSIVKELNKEAKRLQREQERERERAHKAYMRYLVQQEKELERERIRREKELQKENKRKEKEDKLKEGFASQLIFNTEERCNTTPISATSNEKDYISNLIDIGLEFRNSNNAFGAIYFLKKSIEFAKSADIPLSICIKAEYALIGIYKAANDSQNEILAIQSVLKTEHSQQKIESLKSRLNHLTNNIAV